LQHMSLQLFTFELEKRNKVRGLCIGVKIT